VNGHDQQTTTTTTMIMEEDNSHYILPQLQLRQEKKVIHINTPEQEPEKPQSIGRQEKRPRIATLLLALFIASRLARACVFILLNNAQQVLVVQSSRNNNNNIANQSCPCCAPPLFCMQNIIIICTHVLF
jgi:negative regulator of sigma E activity